MKRILTLLLLMLSLGTARAEPRKIVQWVENTSFPWAQIATQQGIALADDGTIWALSYNGAPPFCSLTNLESMGTYLWTAVSLVPVPSHRKIIQVFPVQWTGPDLFIWPSESIGQSGIRALMNDGTLWMLADTLPGCTCDNCVMGSAPPCTCAIGAAPATHENFAWVQSAPALPTR